MAEVASGSAAQRQGHRNTTAVRSTTDSRRLRSALSAGHWSNTMIEMTLKVKITAAQIQAFARFVLLLVVAIA